MDFEKSKKEEEFIDRHINNIAEHWDVVHIMCSLQRPDGATEYIIRGCGNRFARNGLCHDFLTGQKQVAKKSFEEECD